MINTKRIKSTIVQYLILLFMCFFYSHASYSQNQSAQKLVDRLEILQNTYGVAFTYNNSLLDQVLLPANFNCNNLSNCIAAIKENAPINFLENGPGSFMVVPIRKDVTFTVVDKDTGESIGDITVQVNKGEERFLYPIKSTYTVKNLFPLDSVHIRSAFYNTLHVKASELLNMNTPLRLEHAMIHLNEVQITDYLTRGVNTKISDNTFQINMESLGLLAGETDGDVFNVVKNIPGVHTPSGKPGNLNFRGSTFDQSLIEIDDIPIYHNGHFYGAIAPYNPTTVSNIEIQRNTLAAKWGGRVGGLIHMTTKNKVPDSTSYTVQANMVYAGATVEIPVVKDKLAFYVAGRSNYPGINSPKLTAFSNLNFQGSRLEDVADEVNSDNFKVGFYDINSKLIYDINENHKATVSYINIQNRLSATLEDFEDKDNKDFRDLYLDNWGMTIKWEGTFSDRLSAQARLSKSSLYIDNKSEGFSAEERSSFEKYSNTINDTRFISEVQLQINEYTTLETGYTLTDYSLRYDERNDEESIDSGRNQDALNHSMFASINKNWNDKVTANFGLHSDYYGPNKKLYADPRVSINVRTSDALFLKSSAGRSHQFIQKKLRDDFDDFNDDSQFWFLPDQTTSVLEGYQTMLGALYTKSGWLVDVELYVRNTNNVTLQTNTETLKEGKLKSIGADFFIKKRWNNFEALFSYSLSEVDTDFGETLPIYFDQRHILHVTGLWHLDPFNLAVTWGYFSGMPVVVPDFETDEGTSQSDLDIVYTNRFPSMHQLDVSATYSFTNTRKTWKGIVGLSILNLYDQDNIVNIFQNEPPVDDPYRKTIDFAPNLQLSIQF
ncbi:TonB-dependent receptor plug domain-containing protein [Maribacter litoralis]|uniref:TonB-dependent receptor plug domain-containing protein n=1 Tax=Maribacter litoralis TaxID=2059726 RepID=UPI003D2981FE